MVTPEGSAAVEAIAKGNGRVTVNEMAAHLDISHGSAHRIVRGKKLTIFKGFVWITLVKLKRLTMAYVKP